MRSDAQLRAELSAAARAARDEVGATLVPKELLSETMTLLADYRSEHGESRSRP